MVRRKHEVFCKARDQVVLTRSRNASAKLAIQKTISLVNERSIPA